LAGIRLDPPSGAPAKRDVLLVPGFTGSKEDFIPILGPIGSAGHRVTAIDLRGQLDSARGDSAGAESAGGDSAGAVSEAAYTVSALAADLGDVLAALDRPAHLLGHSFGGLVARAAALAQPRAVSSLTLLGSGPAAIPPPAADRLVALRPMLEAGGVAAVWAAVQALEAAEPGYVEPPPDVAEFLRRRYLAMPAGCLGGMARGLLDEPDRVAELAASGLPVLVTHGESDDAWPPAVQRNMADRLGARYIVVPGAVHSPAIDNPQATAANLLTFWRSVEAMSG
jgi:pimeloyl-ACP methyl ester carboxylesterase